MKINEYNSLRAEYINAKLERDKYYQDYNMLKEDYNENNEKYQENYLNLQKENKEKEIKMNKEIGYLNNKVKALEEEKMRLQNINNELDDKIKEFEAKEDMKEKLEKKK